MSEWKEYKLSDFIDINPKVTLKSGSKHSFVEMKDLNESQKFVLPSQLKEVKGGARFQNFDTLFARITPCLQNGKISQVKGLENSIGFGSTEFLVFRGKESISNTDFVYYLSRYDVVRKFAEQNMIGTSGRQRVSKDAFENIELLLPSLPTQTAIAEILSSLDDKIELNNKINQELENLAQTLFKRWFIDFEFPDENGNPYKSSGGEMVDSELGEIPKGWEVFKIGEVLDLVSGYPFKGESFSKDGNYGIVTIKNVQDGLFVEQIDNYIDKLPNKFPANIRLTVGDILMSLTGNVGRVCYVTSDNCLLNQRVVKFNSVQENANAFWYYYFRQNVIKDLLISISKGTAQLNLSPVETKLLKCKLPRIIAPNILSAFDVLFRKQIECSMANKNLCNLRNTLLPKLISGELEVNQTLN